MMLVSSDVTTRRLTSALGAPALVPDGRELGWQWSEAVEGARLTRHTTTAKIPLTLTPQVHSVDLGPPATLLVRMLPGQITDDSKTKRTALLRAWEYRWSMSRRTTSDGSRLPCWSVPLAPSQPRRYDVTGTGHRLQRLLRRSHCFVR